MAQSSRSGSVRAKTPNRSLDANHQLALTDTTRALCFAGSNDYVNNFLRPFMADGIVYTHDEFIGLLMDTIDRQLTVSTTTTRRSHCIVRTHYWHC